MSTFEKGNLTVDGNTIHMAMPFTKVNKEKRTVSGYATLDNLDSQGDVVTAEASAKAFARARGNLREMHEKIAAGRVVDWHENEYLDEDGKLYRGIYVTAYVSKGAESTWEKVLDGTLSGFSIGGEVNDASNDFVKEAGRTVRFIKDYDLVELSLVDNPANQLANVDSFSKSVFAFNKSASGSVTEVTGLVSETSIESVFICKNDFTTIVDKVDSATCPKCEAKMENAGWFESGVGDRAEKVKEIVSKFQNPVEAEAAPTVNSEGGVEMARKENAPVPEGTPTEVVNPSEEFPDGEKVDENADVDETAGTEEVVATATPEEVQDDETEISKKIDDLHEAVKESLAKTRDETKEHVEMLEKKIDEISETLTTKASELEERFNRFGEELKTAKARQASLEKSLEALNNSDAVKKSVDSDNDEPTVTRVQKSVWTPGAFSGKPQGFSIDDHM
jgi:cob(I)alamin adenosyltransferase